VGVGDSLELPYRIKGPFPAGTWRLYVEGYQSTGDGVLRAEVIHRPGPDAGTGGTVFLTATGTPPPPDAGSNVYLDVTLQGAMLNANCGDTLVFRITQVSGTSDFYEIFPELDVP
jgi:hypothetical protein